MLFFTAGMGQQQYYLVSSVFLNLILFYTGTATEVTTPLYKKNTILCSHKTLFCQSHLLEKKKLNALERSVVFEHGCDCEVSRNVSG